MKKRNIIMFVILLIIFGLNISVYAEDCTGIFGKELINEINSILDVIRFAAPVVFLLLTSFEFAKVVFSDNKDALNKAKNNFLKRGVAVLIIFFAPTIISFILGLVDEVTMKSCLEQLK